MGMSAHERRVLAEMARRLAAQDPDLATVLRAWSAPVEHVPGSPVARRQPAVARCCTRVRGWVHFPGRVAVAGGVLTVVGLFLSSQLAGPVEPVPPTQAVAEVFTEQIPVTD